MRKIALFMMISVDGYFEGPSHELDWHNVNAEFGEFANKQLDEADVLIFGSRTYDLMSNYWPKVSAEKESSSTAQRMNSMNKLVFSRTMKKADWEYTTLLNAVRPDEINALKTQPGKDLLILGSSNLCLSFLEAGLLDEVRVMVNPVILGKGNILFNGLKKPLKMELIKSREFKSGNILLYYRPRQEKIS
jgi:dihydrofolate reductase